MSIFCSHVINHISIPNVSGIIKPCCRYEYSDDLPTIYNVESLDNAITHLTRKQLKRQFEDGIKPQACNSCWSLEEQGLKSRREWGNQLQFEKKNCVQDIEFALDFTCNMMCRICGPESSSKWNAADIADDLGMERVKDQSHYIKTLKHVLENSDLSQLRKITLVGGEPFYSKNIEWLVDLLDRKSDISQIQFFVVTNGSIYPNQNLLSKLLNFKKFIVFASVDAIGPLANVIRWGAEWEVISKNIDKYIALRDKFDNVDFEIQTVVSVLNVNHMQELSEYFGERNVIVGANPIENPQYLAVQNIPLDKRMQWTFEPKHGHDYVINGIIKSQNKQQSQDGFNRATNIIDKYQGTKFSEVNPEIVKIMENRDES